jgi:SAM-dependent methyltransferase
MSEPTINAEAFRHFERTSHNRIADSYLTFFEPVTQHAIAPLLNTVHVGAGTRLLDVATGSGGVAARAAARGAVVTGVDLASRMVELAAQRYPQLAFHVADVATLPFAEASFDAVVCNFGLGHFPRPERAMAECVRVLVAGGRLGFSWWDVPARTRLQGVLIEALQEAGAMPPPDIPLGPPMFRFSAEDEFTALLRSAGLIDVVVQGHSFSHWVATPNALWTGTLGSLARTAGTILGQTAAMQQRIRTVFDRLVRAYASGGGIALPMAYKIAAGCKP